MCRNRLFLAFILLSQGILVCPAGAAPSVKKLDGITASNTPSNVNKESLMKLSTASARAPSIRAMGLSNKSGGVAVNNTESTTTNTADSARFSGLHGNLFKGISSKLSSNSSSQQGGSTGTSSLAQRIAELEAQMANKQDVLQPGDGIDIDGNTISLNDDTVSLPERMEEIAKEIDDLVAQFNTQDYYTVSETQAYLEENYYTKDEVDKVVSQLSNPNVVNEFDPGFLHQ